MIKKIIFAFIVFFHLIYCHSQDLPYARIIIDTLCSSSMYGRGYVNNGNKIAADFLKNEFIRLKIDSFSKGYFQTFPVNVNSIVGNLKFSVGKKTLIPGVDFIVDVFSPTCYGTYKTFIIDSSYLSKKNSINKLRNIDFSKKIMVIDKKGISDKDILALLDGLIQTNYLNAKACIYIQDKKLTWGLSDAQIVNNYPVFEVLRKSLPEKITKASFLVNNKYVPDYQTQNIIGYIKGKIQPDSFLVFTAHYDHLGMMGDQVMFPGANDNASGVAMALNLMKYYAMPENQPDFSIVFIATSAEELGILGSKYYTQHPVFDLAKIKFLINLDMVSTGDDGIMVVNGGVFNMEYDRLLKINSANNYIKTISKRGEAKNSDHWYFYKKGVKCFFIYTMGGISEYHNIYDIPKTLPFTEYNDLFKLLTDFVKTFN